MPAQSPVNPSQLDWHATLRSTIEARRADFEPAVIASAFHRGLARSVTALAIRALDQFGLDTVVLSGGVFQNHLLLRDVSSGLRSRSVRVWSNQHVPPNGGGLSLGQAALAAMGASR